MATSMLTPYGVVVNGKGEIDEEKTQKIWNKRPPTKRKTDSSKQEKFRRINRANGIKK